MISPDTSSAQLNSTGTIQQFVLLYMSARLRPTTILPVLRMLVSMQTDLLVQIHRLMFSAPSSTKDQPQDVENLPTSKSDWRKSSRQRSKNHPSNLAPSLTPLFNVRAFLRIIILI
ncbi:hypothetical protein FB446DRAFT_795685 [Lentinula raphanica]|nr:hypothetical protein FB446DRAFT_795685 [Lentinula raphanica]